MVGQCIALELFWFTSPPRRREKNCVSFCVDDTTVRYAGHKFRNLVESAAKRFGFASQVCDEKMVLLRVEDAAI